MSLRSRIQKIDEALSFYKSLPTGTDEAHIHSLITHLEQWIERHPCTTGADIQWENVAWLKKLGRKKPMESE